MSRRKWLFVIVFNLIILVVGILPFLPGPNFLQFASGIYSFLQVVAIFGLIFILPGLIFGGISIWRKKHDNSLKLNSSLFLTLPLTLFISVFWISNHARDFSRNFAINQTDGLIHAIEKYKMDYGLYPDSLNRLVPSYLNKLPNDKIIGIKGFHYQLDDNSYKIEFSQNVIMGFNFEIVQYSPTGEHKGDGEMPFLYDTNHPNWKYYIFD